MSWVRSKNINIEFHTQKYSFKQSKRTESNCVPGVFSNLELVIKGGFGLSELANG